MWKERFLINKEFIHRYNKPPNNYYKYSEESDYAED